MSKINELHEKWRTHFQQVPEEREKLVQAVLNGGNVREQAMNVRHEEALAEHYLKQMVKEENK